MHLNYYRRVPRVEILALSVCNSIRGMELCFREDAINIVPGKIIAGGASRRNALRRLEESESRDR